MKFSNKTAGISLIVLIALTLLLIFITDRYILTIDFYDNSGDPVAGIPAQEKQVYENLQQWIYFSSAVYLLIKIAFIALVLYTALYLADHQVRFVGVFQVVTYAETVFFVPAAAKIIFFHIYYPNGTLSDWHRFYIGSSLAIFDSVPADWFYALQTLNVFEVIYWFALALRISKLTKLTFDKSIQIVLCSYIPALLIWVAAVTFFILMMFPSTG
jgi:hypothetical protein